jgi:calcium-dependent protein kinase
MENNPYVIELMDVFETDEELHLVTEYCEGGELFDALQKKTNRRSSFRRGRYSEPQASRIANQILRALMDLHSHNIVHRDVKAENILLVNNDESDIQVKLCDFGMARVHRESFDPPSDGESSPSTPGLAYSTNSPPEACHGAFGPAMDVYSLGVTLYILLCGFPPVFCDDYVVFPEAYWADISDAAKATLRKMLHPDPCQRDTAADALKDPWIRQQTTRVRRGSISANLEIVRKLLYKSIDGPSPTKRARQGSFCAMSPRKRRMSTDLSFAMTDLYNVSEKRDVRVIDETIETRASEEDISSTPLPQNVACG